MSVSTVLLQPTSAFSSATVHSLHLLAHARPPTPPPTSMADLSPAEALRLLAAGIRSTLALCDPSSTATSAVDGKIQYDGVAQVISPQSLPVPPMSPPLAPQDMPCKADVSPSATPAPPVPGALSQMSPGCEHVSTFTSESPADQSDRIAVDKMNQRAIISRRFWSKSAPEIDIEKYLLRIHQYCPISTAVYLATSVYIHQLCMVTRAMALTPLNVHRLVLAALRVASKNLEDINHQQKRFAKVGGLSEQELCRLEIGFLFLMDFDLKVDIAILEAQAGLLMELERIGR
ncbi:cyclin-domain-containing protein [Limtongia smithiae]|uniref:cyclin-domain-containing protein n=1 Tax=Limtongia smithiae TaxID=1125753 RepID=UPI0034CD5AD4